MNGRVYDYQIGRFLSVDPFIQFPLNSQSLNPYSYVLNNPLSGTDPSGYCEASVGTHICGVEAVGTETSATGSHLPTGIFGNESAGTGPKKGNGGSNGQGTTGASGRKDQAAPMNDKGAGSNLFPEPAGARSSPALYPDDMLDKKDPFDFSKLHVKVDPENGIYIVYGSLDVGGTARDYASTNMNYDLNTSGEHDGKQWVLAISFKPTDGKGDLNINWMTEKDQRTIHNAGSDPADVRGQTPVGSRNIVLNKDLTQAPIRGRSDIDSMRIASTMTSVPGHEFITHSLGQSHTFNSTNNMSSYSEQRAVTWDDFRAVYHRLTGGDPK
jgi:hypothetical protein